MVLKPDQERVKALLKDTITLLCKNGLDFRTEFSIDAVIGVTLDKDDLFYISLAETVTTGQPPVRESTDEEQLSDTTASQRHRRRKRRKDAASKSTDSEDSQSDGDHEGKQKRLSLEQSSGFPVKQEVDEEDEIVIIKEEPQPDWGGDNSGDQYLQGMSFDEYTDSGAGTSRSLPPEGSHMAQSSLGHSSGLWPRVYEGSMQGGKLSQPGGPNSSLDPSLSSTDHQMEGRSRGDMFQCPICNTCIKWTNRQRHMNAHKGRHPYSCDLCGRGYTSRDNLRGHYTSVHSGSRDFSCPICAMAFGSNSNLKSHLRKQHGQDPMVS